jgi:hypothetical protein
MIIIVLGMHRSGTSSFAGVLHLNNISMGTYKNFWPRPLAQNPKGFYENYNFRKINDKLLNEIGYDVKSYNPTIPSLILSEKKRKEMENLILKSNRDFGKWGWKDPRTCLTINLWMNIIKKNGLEKDVKIVFVSRNPLSVARSLKKRNDLPIKKGLELWNTYTEKAFLFCQNFNSNIFYCSFEQLLEKPGITCEKLFNFLDQEWDEKVIHKFIDKKISTSGKGINIKIPEKILLLHHRINNLLC